MIDYTFPQSLIYKSSLLQDWLSPDFTANLIPVE